MYVPRSSIMHLIIICSCLLLFHNHVQAQLLQICSNTANYTSNSQFQTNLNLLLPSLLSNGPRDGFFNTTVGTSPDTVYGLVQCRGDASTEDCRRCLNNSVVDVIRKCPNRKEATLRYDLCIIRYSNTRFFSHVDSNNSRGIANAADVSEADVNRFNRQLGNLFNNLSTAAASVTTKFDLGSINYTNLNDIYGLVTCTRDLSATQCSSCLQRMVNLLPSCCENSIGAQVFSPNCHIIYELFSFFQNSSQSPPPALQGSPSPPPPVQGTGNACKFVNIVAIVVLAIVAEDVARRPTMASVVLMLNIYSVTIPLPTAPVSVSSNRTELGGKIKENGASTNNSSQSVLPDHG
ncbi:hypothetical protein IFM89_009550 [Coptis chinensis]|uniref:Gnk2-homologous domain-containing protein n=1 Tax=Coptis chinensis TaxID=261450 RepID=A0A835IC59_9MAGN|nr:hypothetical protein IFM89_009550 [Coptis chinensis]